MLLIDVAIYLTTFICFNMSKARITSTSQSIKDDYMQGGGDILNILDQLMENE